MSLLNWFEERLLSARNAGVQPTIEVEGETFTVTSITKEGGAVALHYALGGSSYGALVDRSPRRRGNSYVVIDVDGDALTLYFGDPAPSVSRRQAGRAAQALHRTYAEKNYLGTRFGQLVIREILETRKGNRMVLCECGCGGKKEASLSALRAGKVISCGCKRGKNTELPIPSGARYGALTVLRKCAPPEGAIRKEGYYVALCDCGVEVIRRRERLVRPQSPSCGCRGQSRVIGMRFGKLTVAGGSKREGRHLVREAVCDCGRSLWVRQADMRSGKRQSCGECS